MKLKWILALCFFSAQVMAESASPFTGWHWYNEPIEQEKKKAKKAEPAASSGQPDYNSMSASELVKVLHDYTMESLHQAQLNPSNSEAVRNFLQWQDFWTNRASLFSESVVVEQLKDPSLDYNTKVSNFNASVPYRKTQERKQQEAAIQKLSQKYALFYFYRGNEALDVAMGNTVKSFSISHNVAVMFISVDGNIPQGLLGSKVDNGQANNMGVKAYPALFLVSPKEKQYYPLAYGFMSQDDIGKRYVSLSTGFKPMY